MTEPDSFHNPSASDVSSIIDASELIMTKKILSLREHYDIADRLGNIIAKGEGNFIQIPAIFDVFDTRFNQMIMQIKGKVLTVHNQFTFIDKVGEELGTIRKKLLKLIGEEYWIEKNGLDLMRIYGNFLEHDYSMEIDGKVVATVHRKWVSLRDQYSISILGAVDHRLVIGAAIVIEHIEVSERRSRS